MPKNHSNRSRRASAPKKSKTKPTAAASPTWQAEYTATMGRLASTLDLKNLDDVERAFLATCQKIERRFTGCNSPFEEFFHNLVRCVQRSEWPTPEDAAAELDTFREHFDDMRRDAAWFLEAYPQAGVHRRARTFQDDGATPGAEGASILAALPPAEPEPADSKDWERRTPALIYRLECFSPSELEQKVGLTREEYIALKEQLARIRGFAAQEAARTEGGQGRG